MIEDSTGCPDHHRVLRLSLTKHKQKKIFLKCKKEIEKDIGSSKRNWFEDLTLCIVPGIKWKKDVLTSPVTQDDLSFSKTPDLIKQQYELTPGSSAPLSVGHILDSQGVTPSPLRGWSPPLLGLSPVSSTQEGEDNLCHDAVNRHEANLIKSLGISPNDSSMSWTSSLATPCTLRLPLSDSSCDGDSRSSKGHVKGLPRVLFSPDPSLNITESKQEDTLNDSSHGITEDDTKKDYNRMSFFSGREEQCSEVNKELENKVIKKEYIRNDDLDSMPLFSQDLLSSPVVNLSQQKSWNVENNQVMKPSDQTAVCVVKKEDQKRKPSDLTVMCVKEEDQMMNPSDQTAVCVVKKEDQKQKPSDLTVMCVKEEDQMTKPSDQTAVGVKEEDQMMKSSDLTAVSDVIEEIKAEVVSDTLSDFFDPPSKSVGRRRCAPSRGKKRKSEELSWNDSVYMDNHCSTPKEAVPIKSILSSEKGKNSQERTRKRVRFSEDGDVVKLFLRSTGTYSEDKMDNSSSKFKGMAINENESDSAVFMPDKSTSELEEPTSSNQDKVRPNVASVDTESSTLSDRDEDLFSQVSPSALSEMCSVAFAEDKDNLQRLPSDLRTKKCEPENITSNEESHMNDPVSTERKSRSHDSSALVEEKPCLTEQIHEGKYNNSTTVLGSTEAEKETCDSNITDDVSKIPVRKSLSLKQKPCKFFYPTKKQIKTSHPEFVYEFPNKVTVEVPKQNDIQSSTARNPDDRILLSEKIVTNDSIEMRNSNSVKETSDVKEMSKGNGVTEISNSSDVRETSNSNGFREMSSSNRVREKSNCNGVREMSNINLVTEMSNSNCVTEISNSNGVTEMNSSYGFREMNNMNGVREMSNSNGIRENSTTFQTKIDSKADILGFQRFSSLRNQGNNTDVFDDDIQGLQFTDEVKSHSDCDSIPVHQQLREDNSKLSKKSAVPYKTIEQSEYTKSEVLAQSVHNTSNQNTESICQENTEDDRRENTGSITRVLDNIEENEYNRNMGTPHNNDTHHSSASVMSTKTSCDPSSASVMSTRTSCDPSSASVKSTKTSCDPSSASVMSTKTSCDPSSASVMSTKTSCDPSSASVMSTKTSCDPSSASVMSTKTSCDPSSASVMSTKTSCNLSSAYIMSTKTSCKLPNLKNPLLTKSLNIVHNEPNSTGFQNAKAANEPLCHQNKVNEQKLDSLLPNQWTTTITGKSAKVSHFGSYQKKRKDLFADIFEELGNIDEMSPGHKLTSNITGFMSASGKDFKSEKLYEKPGMKNVGKVSPKTGSVKNLFSDIFDEYGDLGMKSGENQPQDGFISFKTASGKDLKSGSFLLNSSELVSKKCSANKVEDPRVLDKYPQQGSKARVLDKYPQQGSNVESPELLYFKTTNRTREKKPLHGVKGANIFADIFEEYSEDAKIPDLMSETTEGLSGFRSAGGKEMSANFHTVINCEESNVDKGIEHTDITTGAGPRRCLSKRTSSGQLKAANLFCDIFEELGHPGIDVSDQSGNESSFVGFKSATGEELKAGFISVKNVEANSITCTANSFPTTHVSSEFKIPVPLKNVTNVKSSRQQEMKSATLAAKFADGSNIPKGFRPFKPPKILKAKTPGKELSNDAKEKSGSMDQQASMVVIKQDNLPTEEKIENLFMEEMFIDELEPSQRLSPDSGRPVKKAKYETDEQSSSVMLTETKVTDVKCPESKTISKEVNKQVNNKQSSSSPSRPVKMETPVLSTSDRVDMKGNQNGSTCGAEVCTTQRKESSDSDFGEEFYNVNEIEMLEKHYIDKTGTDCQTVSGNSKVSKSGKGTDGEVEGEEKSVESRDEGTNDDLLISNKADCYRQQRNDGDDTLSFRCGFTTAGGNKVEGPSRKSLEAACRMMAITDEDIITMPIDREKDDVSDKGSVWKQELFDELTKPFSQVMGKEVCKDNVTCDEFSTVCGDGQSTDAERVDISSCDKDVTEGHNMSPGDPSGTVTARDEINKRKASKVVESALILVQHVDQSVTNVPENIDDMEKDTYKGVLEAEVCSDRLKPEDEVCKPDIKTNTATVTVSKQGNSNPSEKSYVCTDAVPIQENHSVTKAKGSENICNSTSGEIISSPFQSASGKAIGISAKSLQAAWNKMKDSELPTLNVQSRFDKSSDVITTSLSPERKSSESDKETAYCPFQNVFGKVINVSTDATQAARESSSDDQNFVSSPFHSASGRLINVSVNSLKAARKTLVSDQEVTVNSPFQSTSGRNISISESSLKAARKTLESDQELTENSPFQSASGRNISISESSLKAARKTLESDQELTVNSPFQSTSGRNISISESSLKAARKTLESDQELTVNSPFQSASGRNISISESSLKAARKTLESDQEVTVNSPFQSASGRNISISENSLKAARKTLESDQEVTLNSPFQSASGRNISISENSLKAARKTLESDQEVTVNSPFQSASGRNISISESSLKAARKTLESDQEVTVNSPFQSASGRNISISESSLKAARKTLESDQELTENSPFQSASGRNISISESSLKAARKTLESDQELTVNSPFQSTSGRNISISESSLKAARKTLESDQELTENSPFQSASGRNISISESSLKAARKTLESDQEVTVNSPFQSASGRNISIGESSLKAARKTLESEEGTICLPLQVASDKTVDTSSKSLSTTRKTLENGKEAINSPFQSASDRTIGVSSDSLLAARKTLKSDHEAISSLFQSASGRTVNVSSNSLHAARKMWDTNDENCMLSSNDLVCDTSHSLPITQRTISNTQEEQAKEITVMAENSQSSQHHSRGVATQGDSRGIATQENNRDVATQGDSRGVATQGDKGRDPPSFDDFVMAGDFDEEMETPQDPEMENKDDRLGVKPFSTDPEKFSLDRRVTSISYSPLQCRSLRQNVKINPSSGQTPEVSTVYQGSLSFKTPYKDTTSGLPDAKPQNTGIKPKTPVFGVKPRQMSVSKDKSVPVCNTEGGADQILPVQSNKADLVHNVEGTSVCEVIDKDRCEKHNEKIDIPALCEARTKQSDMIEARSKVKVRPVEGILYKLKCNKQRSKLRDLFDMTRTSFKKNQKSSSLELAQGVTAGNATNFTFRLADYYGANVTSVYLGDGAFVVPDDRGNVGHSELYQGFLTVNGVDKKLISREWFINHYRWIIWKLAAYERMATKHMAKWALTPENVMLQMKYRYDREVDKCHRSAIKKISERDDTSCKRMVLLVSGIGNHGNSKAESTDSTSSLDSKVSVELSDGWYSIPTTVDIPLSHLIQQGRIREGHKLCISGAEITGCEDACSPLEMPAGLSLNICTNSTRPADWDCRLGYHKDPRPLCVPLCTLYGEGGSVGRVDVVLLRKYPVMYMEKLPDGGCVFRSAQAEEKYQQQYQRSQQDQMEKMYSKMEKIFEDEEEDDNCITKKRWTKKEVEHLQTGHEIYEAYKTTRQPDIFEGYLSEGQMTMLIEYRRQLLEERRHKLQSEFNKAWADNEKNVRRTVVPLIKLRVLGCCRKDLDSKKSTLVTVWRPEQDIEHLKEGTRYKVYGLTASTARSKYTESPVQVTASRHTRFQSLPLDENVLDMIYEPRQLQCVIDLRSGMARYGESDIIGVVIEVDHTEFTESGKIQDIVYCADCNRDFFGVKFWGGIKVINSCDTLTHGKVVCFSNLLDRSSYRSSILPVLEWSSEFSLCSQSPQRQDQRGVVRELQEMVKAAGSCGQFLEDCGRILEEVLHRKQEAKPAVTPQKQNLPESSEPVPEEMSERMRKHKLLYQSKMSHLMAYGTPTTLSSITSPMPKSVRKEFVPPKLCRKDL